MIGILISIPIWTGLAKSLWRLVKLTLSPPFFNVLKTEGSVYS
jgi:hypothetical protein